MSAEMIVPDGMASSLIYTSSSSSQGKVSNRISESFSTCFLRYVNNLGGEVVRPRSLHFREVRECIYNTRI